jgi:hypothetical protein
MFEATKVYFLAKRKKPMMQKFLIQGCKDFKIPYSYIHCLKIME